jgi:UDP-glucose 4-epimerase
MRVLITGGAGFIGAHLAQSYLAEGCRVDLLDNLSRGQRDDTLTSILAMPGANLVERDLIAPGALDGLESDYDTIVHLAAIVGVANVNRQPYSVLRKNVDLLSAILALAARQRDLKRLVFASTSEVYAGTAEAGDLPIPTPEDVQIVLPDLAGPRSSYLMSKLYGEAMCRHAGVPFTIIRPHNVYGPRMGLAHVVPELMQRATQAPDGGRLTVHSPDHCRAFCYVSDAVTLIKRLAAAPQAQGGVFNIGNQMQEIAMADLAKDITQIVGRRLKVEHGADTPGSPRRRCPDMTRSIAAAGFEPRVSLDQGLRETYAWYARHVFADAVKAAS